MTTIKYLILFCFIISCNRQQNEIENVVPKNTEIRNEATKIEGDFKNRINDSVYAIKKENRESFINLFYSKDQNKNVAIDSIIIRNKSNNNIQKIKLKKNYFLPEYQAEYCMSAKEDINFDGFSDLSIINYYGNYNSSSSYWVYKKNQKKYKQVKSLDSIYNADFDNSKKEIYSEWRVAFEEFHSETYFWKNDQIILKEENIKYSERDSNNTEVKYSRKLINGKYIENGVKH
jgi:predicted Holliday junction resolvase-like endonuclease